MLPPDYDWFSMAATPLSGRAPLSMPVPSSKALRVVGAVGTTIVVVVAAAIVYVNRSAAPTPPTAQTASTPSFTAAPAIAAPVGDAKAQAMQALMALPELKAWSARLSTTSGGKVHGALIEYDPAPKIVAGKAYWQFSFVENGAEAARNWESFLVAKDGSEILIDDLATDKILSLAQWRHDKHPMLRTDADSAD